MATQVQKNLLISNLNKLADKCDQNIGAPGVDDTESGYYESAALRIRNYIRKIDKIDSNTLNSNQINFSNKLTLATIDELNNGIDFNDITTLSILCTQLDTLSTTAN